MNGAHLHLLLNHLPLLGTVFGLLLLLFSLWRKSAELQRVSLGVFVLTALSSVPAYLTGEPAEGVVEHLPGVAKAFIEAHESAALVAFAVGIATGIVALASLFLAWRSQQFPTWLTLATLFLALATGGLMARAANLGGMIRHTEIRSGASPAAETEHEKQEHEKHD